MGLHRAICTSPNTPQSPTSSCMLAYFDDTHFVVWSLDCHATGPPAAETMYPVVDLRVSISPAQSTSVKTCMSKALPLNLMPFATVPRTDYSRYTINLQVPKVGFAPNSKRRPTAYAISGLVFTERYRYRFLYGKLSR